MLCKLGVVCICIVSLISCVDKCGRSALRQQQQQQLEISAFLVVLLGKNFSLIMKVGHGS